MNIQELIGQDLERLYAVKIPASSVQIQKTKKEFKGHLTLVVFPLLKISKKNPEQTAQEIGEYLMQHQPSVAAFNVIKGFLNLTVAPAYWIGILNDIACDTSFGTKQATTDSPLVMIEYSSPNTNKPLHLGHIRNNLLGYSISEILKANGNRVVKTNIVNDRGIHICKSMLAWKRWGNGETPESTARKGDHLIGDYYVKFDQEYKKEISTLQASGLTKEEAEKRSPLMAEAREMLRRWEAGDQETVSLWKTMNSWVYAGFDQTYKALGVDFDQIYYESNTYLEGKEKVLEGLKKGIFYQQEDGSVWADLTTDGLDEKLLLRADGTSVYMTQDIGTAKLRFDDYPIDKMVYVVGNEQNYHFQVLSLLLDKLGFEFGKGLVHFSYGMVELPEGKMKSREGTVVDADDLMDEMVQTAKAVSGELGKLDTCSKEEAEEISRIVGMGALKYFILKVDPRKNMVFNPKESIDFNGNTGPFIQYAYARIQSVLRKSAGCGHPSAASDVIPNEKEVALIQLLSEFPSVVQEAAESFSPAIIANYVYELVKEYNQFYHDYSILKEENEAVKRLRLVLSDNVGKVIKTGFGLLGIRVPERM
ncbi:MAG: Arginine--tRNA ligase [Candidatus Ordinivivax streblomastigis]|uniref:Arginine--tRNA ligase n=1 Tax=Candidatus Ordinivivax streblomastigis TaxID=2540710 RepID=A0A5M8P0B9_9BACT|nr:MAG: Arginine--tRNA ligase [Candidatus Ordinivivax streblomastigis]